ncbi:DNA repair and recombination protein RAD54B-like [Ctenocephalides felis]|uniref:DNA repair and recombination protein RAD54B-like n=1 Tax=Ctenocephalides felis TaxID=7515 RepID=UPI000E6E2D79|nr:DNA repair and recombination protein RAD54B-like [Ctenocephalides felis]
MRSTAKILKLLSSSEDCKSQEKEPSTSVSVRDPSSFDEEKKFKVVWGKNSSKKHKSYEDDGVLVVTKNSIVLKNSSGSIIAQTRSIDDGLLEPESTFSVGSKIVQIVEVISKPILKSISLNTEEKLPHTEINKKLSGITQPTKHKGRSTSEILKACSQTFTQLGQKENCNIDNSFNVLHQNTIETDNSNRIANDIKYNVIWGNRTSKKNKTFEEDGILKFVEGGAILYDTAGTVVDKSKNFKCSVIEYGEIISIGSKDIQVLDSISSDPIPSTTRHILNNENNEIKSMKIMKTKRIDECTNSPRKETEFSNEQSKKIFKVVWGKITNKKKKTYSNDGYLEMYGASVILKNEGGTILEKSNKIDPLCIFEGGTMNIGSKAIEIIEQIDDIRTIQHEIKASIDEDEPVAKKIKKLTGKSISVSKSYSRLKKNCVSYEPITFPEPDAEHQWLNNKEKRPLCQVFVDPCLARVLRPHQKDGVIFLYRCLMGFFGEHIGAVLADEMGLGKTLQCITIIWTLLKQGPYGSPCIQKVLIVAPSSLCANWENEFMRWLGAERIVVFVVNSKNRPKDYKKLQKIPVLIISYEMVSRCFEDIKTICFDLIICDEGHRLKNMSVKISSLLMQFDCKRRVIVTGTPIQNDLQEFYSIVNFVNPGILGTLAEFKSYYLQPIVASQQLNCSEIYKVCGELKVKELQQKTAHFILRRTQEIINKYLPKKKELIIFCKITDIQKQVYQTALDYYESRKLSINTDVMHLQLINFLKKICNHPWLIKYDSIKDMENAGDLKSHLCDIINNKDMDINDSVKVKIVLNLLKEVYNNKEKIVLVSYFTQTLDMLADLCKSHEFIYTRLDGSTPTADRQNIIDEFNNPHCKTFIFLLSAKAGGIGLNITGASRLVLFDTDWNPATDLQAMSRIWRDGQKKSVYIYRLITTGTIEEKMLQRQISKTILSGAVVDTQNNSLKLSQEDLKLIFSLNDQKCTTHDILQCNCKCDGSIPISLTEKTEASIPTQNRSCQLSLTSSTDSIKKCLKMNELFQWEHHGFPIAQDILKDLGLFESAEDILFMFKNENTT